MNINTAYFAGGCFWCMTKPFDTFDGIEKVTSGYMGGHLVNPSYEEVKTGSTGHYEVVKIEYDVALFSYHKLLEIFFSVIDPWMMVVNFKIEVLNIRLLFSIQMNIKDS